jgi:hypothetical protein
MEGRKVGGPGDWGPVWQWPDGDWFVVDYVPTVAQWWGLVSGAVRCSVCKR